MSDRSAAPGDAALVVDDLRKAYRRRGAEPVQALDGVSFDVAEGEIVALLGNNGAGKTTLMSVAAGLVPTDSGRVLVHGECVTDRGGRPTRELGLAPQEESLYPTLTARQNLDYFGRLAGLRGAALRTRTTELAEQLALSGQLDVRASSLSGGRRRRLHTGLALMHMPSVLLLDEVTVGVDVEARESVLELVRDRARRGAAVLYSTHQLHEVERLGARVVVIDAGRVLATGSAEALIAAHAPPLVELVLDEALDLPDSIASQLETAAWTTSGAYRVVARLSDTAIALPEVLDQLDVPTRRAVRGATLIAPSLETAFRRLVGGTTAADDAQRVEDGH